MTCNSIHAVLLLLFFIATMLLLSIMFQSGWIINLLNYSNPNALIHFNCPPDVKAVALTIDDATSQGTKYIIRRLKARGSTATFFMIGQRIDMITGGTGIPPPKHQLILEYGNDVGNHGYWQTPAFTESAEMFEESVGHV